MTRRTFVGTAAGLAAGQVQKVTRKGRLKQCVTRGCFAKSGLDLAGMCGEAARRGVVGFDLIGPPDFPALKEHGLIPTMVPGGSTIPDGLNRKELHDGVGDSLLVAHAPAVTRQPDHGPRSAGPNRFQSLP